MSVDVHGIKYNESLRKEIDVYDNPDLDTFKNIIQPKNKPALLKNVVSHWEALKKWNLEYLKEVAGTNIVTVTVGKGFGSEKVKMTFQKYIEEYIEKENTDGYLVLEELFNENETLKKDIEIPPLCQSEPNFWRVLFFGAKGTFSPIHKDYYHNLFVQIVGKKLFRIFDPEDGSHIYPQDKPRENRSHILTELDKEDPDYTNFSLFKNVPYYDVILEPGDMLYSPALGWHYVKSLTTSVSIPNLFLKHKID